MVRLVKVVVLISIIAAAVIGVLWVTDIIAPGQLGPVAGKTFGVLGIVFGAAFAWKATFGRMHVSDHTDQRVP